MPFFLQPDALKPFISEDLLASTTPIFFKHLNGKKAVGYDAELLPAVAEVYLRMRDAFAAQEKAVPSQYDHIVRACDMVMRGLARVGIVALVDEARAQMALAIKWSYSDLKLDPFVPITQ